jgi:sialate O-acetylesterase
MCIFVFQNERHINLFFKIMNALYQKLAGILTTVLFLSAPLSAQTEEKPWNGHECAVVLTYDDGLNVHLDNVVPALEAAGFRGTFYLPGNAVTLPGRVDEWRRVAHNGHELGNHTLFHPCSGSAPGREWVQPEQDLDTYTFNRLMEEIRLGNVLLNAIDGKEQRTFAYSCGDKMVADSSFVEAISGWFVAARDVLYRIEQPGEINRMEVGALAVDGESSGELIAQVEKAREEGGLLVFLFHGVGGEHGINVSLEAHNELVDYLAQHKDEIWVAPMVEVAESMKGD